MFHVRYIVLHYKTIRNIQGTFSEGYVLTLRASGSYHRGMFWNLQQTFTQTFCNQNSSLQPISCQSANWLLPLRHTHRGLAVWLAEEIRVFEGGGASSQLFRQVPVEAFGGAGGGGATGALPVLRQLKALHLLRHDGGETSGREEEEERGEEDYCYYLRGEVTEKQCSAPMRLKQSWHIYWPHHMWVSIWPEGGAMSHSSDSAVFEMFQYVNNRYSGVN